MARSFDGASFLGFTPRAFPAWNGITVAALLRRGATGNYHTVYYAGANGGFADGNVQLGITNADDIYFGTNTAAAVTLAGTIAAVNQMIVVTKATGTATPVAHQSTVPFTTWIHSNMSGTLANPGTAATTLEQVGQWNGSADLWTGDMEWVGVWNFGMSNAEVEDLSRIAPDRLANTVPGCVRFWWFNQPITDNVHDRSGQLADQSARTGTTHTANVALMPHRSTPARVLVPGVV
jgi:hypothetical protein